MSQEIIFNLDQLSQVANQILPQIQKCKIITFTGPLGAGKTTLIKELLKNMGVYDEIVSPTFTYLNIYKNSKGLSFYHFDLYRVKSVDEFLMAGFDEYLFDPNGMSFIEWPEVIESLLLTYNKHVCKIFIDYLENNKRILKI